MVRRHFLLVVIASIIGHAESFSPSSRRRWCCHHTTTSSSVVVSPSPTLCVVPLTVRANRTGRMIPSQVERMPMLPTMSPRGAIISPLLLTNQECPWVITIVTTRRCRIICHFGRYSQRSRMCRRKEDHHRRQQQARARQRRRCCMA